MVQGQQDALAQREREEARERDRNGVLRCVSLARDRVGGAHLTLYYGGGKVSHYLPARVVAKLAIEVDALRAPVASPAPVAAAAVGEAVASGEHA